LNILTALQFCIANGSHNVANAITPLLNIFHVYRLNQDYVYLMGSIAMSLGLLLMGWRVLETIGKKVIILDY